MTIKCIILIIQAINTTFAVRNAKCYLTLILDVPHYRISWLADQRLIVTPNIFSKNSSLDEKKFSSGEKVISNSIFASETSYSAFGNALKGERFGAILFYASFNASFEQYN